MVEKRKKIKFNECIELISKFANDFHSISTSVENVPEKITYKIASQQESPNIERSARKAVFQTYKEASTINKFAFDTRRFDQDTTRNPRSNLQNWVRSEQFIDDETQTKIDIFAKMLKPLEELKQAFGAEPEWHDSYSRALYDHVHRILRVKQADLDIFRPQIAYLEQLMFARYRLSMEELSRIKESDFKEAIIKKDESLLKRGSYLTMTSQGDSSSKNINLSKDGNGLTQESIVNAIFGNNNIRRDGEKTVERTITITIRDSVTD